MSGLLVLRGLLFAAECFLASLLLPLAAFAVAALLRHRAALRHLVFTTMFGVLAVLPITALLLPPRRIVEHVAAPVAAGPVTAPLAGASVAPPSLLTPENIVLLLAALWLAGLAWHLLRLGVGGLGLLRLRRHSAPFASETSTLCAVRLSDGENGPSTFGIFRPIVLLPRSAQAWPAARLDAVLRHEAAHVARRDTLSQFIARLVCAVFWPNPLLWLAARSLRRQAELAADDAVLASGLAPSLYADALVSLAAESRGVASPIPLGIAMAAPPLTQRVEAVLAPNVSRKGVTKMDMARTVTLGLTAALLLGVARFDIAVAQDAPAAPASPAAVAPATEAVTAMPALEPKAAAIAAQAERIKSKADAVTARAKARAARDMDPARSAQYAQDADKMAAQSAQLQAQADKLAVTARQKLAENQASLAQAQQRLAEARPRLAEAQQRLAENQVQIAQAALADTLRQNGVQTTTPPGPASVTISEGGKVIVTKGVTTTFRGADGSAAPRNGEVIVSGNKLTVAGVDTHIQRDNNGVHIDVRIDGALQPQVRLAVQNALMEANRKIDAAIAQGKAGVPGIAPLPSISITPAIAPIAPAPVQ